MYKMIRLLQLSVWVLLGCSAMGQVKDIGQAFTKRGFIQNIDYKEKVMLVNFIEEGEIVNEVVMVTDAQFVNSSKNAVAFTDIKSNDEIIVEGERFNVDKYNEAKKITLVEKSAKSVKNGRIDFIQGDFAYVDGNKIKLAPGKKVKGQKKTGYEKKSFGTVNELKLFDYASLSGKYNPAGFLLADEFTIAPNNESAADKAADTIDRIYQQKFYPVWLEKSKRSKLFGSAIPGIGKVYNDAGMQDYVQNLGMKLVPMEIRDKINFMFVVIDNPGINANTHANGLCYVYTGLLKVLDNEAQLAAILGHEISHVMYEHISKEALDKQKAEARKSLVTDGSKAGKNVLNKAGNLFKTKDRQVSDSERVVMDKNREDLTMAALNLADRQLSTFSVDEEYQADRVGLTIIALAGYDPRQAPVVWKNIYEQYGVLVKPQNVKLSKVIREDLTKDNTKSKSGTKGKTSKITTTGEILNLLIKWKAADYKAKSFKTHPEHIKRFEELNRFISLYWNSDEALEKSATGEDVYASIMKKLKGPAKK